MGDKAACSAGEAKSRGSEERIPEKTTFPSQPQVELLKGRQEGEINPAILVS
jgi:hypothetical protein